MLHTLFYIYIIISYIIFISGIIIFPMIISNETFHQTKKQIKIIKLLVLILSPIFLIILIGFVIGYLFYSILEEVFE